jgi:hypothetical protein
MNSQRAFWISGAATLLVLLLIGGALLGRSTAAEPASSTTATQSQDSEALKAELAQAYTDLDSAYRTIEQLQGKSAGRERGHREEYEEDDDD